MSDIQFLANIIRKLYANEQITLGDQARINDIIENGDDIERSE